MYRSNRKILGAFLDRSRITYQIRKYVKTMQKINYTQRIVCSRGVHDIPDLTKDRYHVKRGNFNNLTKDHVNFFKSVLGDSRVLTEESDVASYNVDWLRTVRGMKLYLRIDREKY